MIRPASRSRPHSPDLTELRRAALAIARSEGWEAEPVDDAAPPGEARAMVTGEGLSGVCCLRVRERSPGRARTDLAARRAVRSEHVVRMVRELPARTVRGREVDAVLAEPTHGALAEVLASGDGLCAGEAATILLGVAAGVSALHAAGWARPELSVDAVVFGRDGCPALDRLDDVRGYSAAAAIADAEAFHALARAVCLRVVDGSGMVLLSAVDEGLRRGSWAGVEQAVLKVAAPEPVRLHAGRRTGARISRAAPTAPSRVQRPGARGVGRPAGRGVGDIARSLLRVLDGRPLHELAHSVRERMRRRPGLVLAALVPVLAAVAGAFLLPAPTDASPAATSSRATPLQVKAPSATAMRTTNATPSAPSPSPSPRGATPAPAGGASPSPGSPPPAAADDPVEAARSLLAERHACFAARAPRPACLDAVLESGSGFADAERAALGVPGSAAARDASGASLSLVERWGDAALVSVVPDTRRTPHSEPASLLLVRGEAGWRLRAVFP